MRSCNTLGCYVTINCLWNSIDMERKELICYCRHVRKPLWSWTTISVRTPILSKYIFIFINQPPKNIALFVNQLQKHNIIVLQKIYFFLSTNFLHIHHRKSSKARINRYWKSAWLVGLGLILGQLCTPLTGNINHSLFDKCLAAVTVV